MMMRIYCILHYAVFFTSFSSFISSLSSFFVVPRCAKEKYHKNLCVWDCLFPEPKLFYLHRMIYQWNMLVMYDKSASFEFNR